MIDLKNNITTRDGWQIREKMQVVADESSREEEPTATALDLENVLRPLAEIGNYVFKRVFGHYDALPSIQQLLPSRRKLPIPTAIQELLPSRRRVSIQVTSEDFILPWELIYSVSLDEPLSYEHFWGMNYILSRVIVQEARPGAFVSPVIPAAPRPKLGLLTYCGLPSVEEKEIPFFEKLDEDGAIALFKLRPLDPANKREEFKEFRSFWEEALSLVHFACHAFYEDGAPNLSRILLSDEFPISLQDMEVYGITINDHPLIILNACETGNLNPLYTSYFAGAFLKYGARGVVATECAVPDDFAADFAQHLYAHLLAGEALGESLLATRRYFLEEHHNPLGLLYSMYGPPSIRLAQRRAK